MDAFDPILVLYREFLAHQHINIKLRTLTIRSRKDKL
jgi:hypothetical protein